MLPDQTRLRGQRPRIDAKAPSDISQGASMMFGIDTYMYTVAAAMMATSRTMQVAQSFFEGLFAMIYPRSISFI